MGGANSLSYHLPFTAASSLAAGLHISASLGGGAAHAFLVDTGSVGILVPRRVLGPDYQDFDPSLDSRFGYVSSGNTYHGQWVRVPVSLGVPAGWDGTGDYPIAEIEVFAVDRPADFDGGMLGIGFGIGGQADGGPARNPLLHVHYHGAHLAPGYVITTAGIDIGLTELNTQGFSVIALSPDAARVDWLQPLGSVALSGDFSPDGFYAELPLLMDTGIDAMILWVGAGNGPPNLAPRIAFPAGVAVTVSAPPAESGLVPALQYAFVTGDASQPMAPTQVSWRVGTGINTGRHVLAGADYLFDAVAGRVGFRMPPG